MVQIDWYGIKFLESASNAKALIHESVGQAPSTKIASDVAICVRQGRLFFEAALAAPLDIRPLQIFYGAVSFAKAVVLARRVCAIDALVQKHGLTDISAQNSKLSNIKLKFESGGGFQEFNDELALLAGVEIYENSMPKWEPNQYDLAAGLVGKRITLKEILSRIPFLESDFKKTYQEEAKALQLNFTRYDGTNGFTILRIDDPELYSDRASLAKLIERLRSDFTFLESWRLLYATKAWRNSIVEFCNIDPSGIDELSKDIFVETYGAYAAKDVDRHNPPSQIVNFATIIPPLAGGLTGRGSYAIQPIGEVHLSDCSLYYLGSFLLSSLVRYRPQIWQRAITSSFHLNEPPDDASLALVERFLDSVLEEFPRIVLGSIQPTPIYA